jgi:hypothetical protein
MKKTSLWAIIYLSLVFAFHQETVLAQGSNSFQGSLNYAITIKGDMAEMMSSAMPKNISVKVKGKNARTHIDGAQAQDLLVLDKVKYQLDHDGKKANKLPDNSKAEQASADKYKITETGKKVTIIGYPCDEYIVTVVDGDRSINSYVYATSKIKAVQNSFGASMFEVGSKIKGFPMRIVMTLPITETSKVDLTIEATAVKEEKIADSEFVIPAGYEVVEMDPLKLMPGMNGRN